MNSSTSPEQSAAYRTISHTEFIRSANSALLQVPLYQQSSGMSETFAVVIQKVIGNAAYKRAFILRQPDVRSGRKKCSYISLCREINDSPPQAVRRHLHILSRYEANFTHLFILLAVNSGFSPDEQVRIFYNSSTNLQPNLECCPQKYKTTHISTTLHPFQSHDMAAQRRQSSLWERISYVSVSVQTE